MLCRVRVPRILIVLKGSQHGTHERYCLIDLGMGSRRARVRWSLRSVDTHWPRVARPPPQSRDSASSTAASPRSAKKARHRPASSAASSAAAMPSQTPSPRLRAPRLEPRALIQLALVVRLPNADRLAREPGGLGRPEATASRMLLLGTARSSRAERELVPLQRRRRAHGHDQRPAADVAARRTLPRCALTCTRPSVARRCRTAPWATLHEVRQ